MSSDGASTLFEQLQEAEESLKDIQENLETLDSLTPGKDIYDQMRAEYVTRGVEDPDESTRDEIADLIEENKTEERRLDGEVTSLHDQLEEKGYDLAAYYKQSVLDQAEGSKNAQWKRDADAFLETQRPVKRTRGRDGVEEVCPVGASGFTGYVEGIDRDPLTASNIYEDEGLDEVDVLDATASPLEGDKSDTLNFYSYANDCQDQDIVTKVETSGAIVIGHIRVVPELALCLKPHQSEAVKLIITRILENKGTLLAHSMGLGKTLSAITVMDGLMRHNKAKMLLLCPKTVLYNWPSELDKWDDHLALLWYSPIDDGNYSDIARWNRKGGLLIMGHERFRKYQSDFTPPLAPDILFVDEAHKLKNEENMLYKTVSALTIPKILLTGSPMQNHFREYCTMIGLVSDQIDTKTLKTEFADAIEASNMADASEAVISEGKAKMRAFTLLTSSCVHRRSSAILSLSLPPKIEYKITYSVPKQTGQLQLFAEREQVLSISQPLKVKLVVQLIDEIRSDTNDSILVFSRKPETLASIRSERDGFYMDGPTSTNERLSIVQKFTADDIPRILYMTTGVGSLGLNLFKANRVIICDPSWNPQDDKQALFRAYRFGQQKPVTVYRLIAWNGNAKDFKIEEYIYRLQVHKHSLASRLVDEQEIDRHFTRKELKHAVDQSSYASQFLLKVNDSALQTVLRQGSIKVEDHDVLFTEEDEELTEFEEQDAENQYNIIMRKQQKDMTKRTALEMITPYVPCIKTCTGGLSVMFYPNFPSYASYDMEIYCVDTNESVLKSVPGATNSRDWIMNTFKTNGSYRFRVRGVDVAESSDWSEWSPRVVV